MFLKYYGLREQPFGFTPDPGYLYFGPSHREALASLFYGIETGCGFLSLIASPGMGKTTLLLRLLEQLRGSSQTVFLFQTQCNSREFMRYLLSDLGIQTHHQDLAQMHQALNTFLLNNTRNGWRFVLVIDEAQNLRNSVLETIRLLSDFEAPPRKLLQIVLSGQPELGDRLSKPDLLQLRQRISITSRLQPLPPEETSAYIDHRLRVAGYAGPPLFGSETIAQIATHSGGIPRNINNICFNALTLAYAKRQERVDISTVSEVLKDLGIQTLNSRDGTSESLSSDRLALSDVMRSGTKTVREEFHSGTSESNGQEGAISQKWSNPGTASSPQLSASASAVAVSELPSSGDIRAIAKELLSEDTVLNGPRSKATVESQENATDADIRPKVRPDVSTSTELEDLVGIQDCAEKAAKPGHLQTLAQPQERFVLASIVPPNSGNDPPISGHLSSPEVSGLVSSRWMSIVVCVSIALGCVFLLSRHALQSRGDAIVLSPSTPQASSALILSPPVDSESAPPIDSERVASIEVASTEKNRTETVKSASTTKPGRALGRVISDTFGELNAHPISKLAKIDPAPDPIVESSPAVTLSLNPISLTGGTQFLAKPEAPAPSLDESEARLRGDETGQVPRLVFSLSPKYPERAKQLGVTGNVVVDVRIDENGNISKMKIITGSPILRKDALNALRGWRYEPAKPGVPRPPVDRVVTVAFQK